ncbi:hypothetical protein OU5_4736 [Pseudomonas mandelii JR-1]|uniref:Uncharacterized protein n=1 Tax=Pseudomonas mandelii JR-1 TaxID=1147786 RepID=A0A024EGY6_9PSED|nr:hypothetical protein OU5_4736 [Pseudomonas mandelii JR-1]
MLPPGREAAPKLGKSFFQKYLASLFYDCCAAEREQAPSPQELR